MMMSEDVTMRSDSALFYMNISYPDVFWSEQSFDIRYKIWLIEPFDHGQCQVKVLTFKSDIDTVFSQAFGIYKIPAKARIQYRLKLDN